MINFKKTSLFSFYQWLVFIEFLRVAEYGTESYIRSYSHPDFQKTVNVLVFCRTAAQLMLFSRSSTDEFSIYLTSHYKLYSYESSCLTAVFNILSIYRWILLVQIYIWYKLYIKYVKTLYLVAKFIYRYWKHRLIFFLLRSNRFEPVSIIQNNINNKVLE